MSAYFNFNGKLIAEGTPVISPDNRGFRYGHGIFETMKAVDGKIVLKTMHFDRLFSGLSVLGLDPGKSFVRELLEEEVIKTCIKNNINAPARIRLTVFGEGETLAAASFIIQVSELSSSYSAMNENGLTIGICSDIKKSCDVLSNLKSNNYLPYMMVAAYARQHNYDDCLALNMHNRICEASIANVFWIRDGAVYTPPLSEGCVAGVMRRYLISQIREGGLRLEEKSATPEKLEEADELFLTNALYGIRWVKQMGSTTYDNQLTAELHKRFITILNQ